MININQKRAEEELLGGAFSYKTAAIANIPLSGISLFFPYYSYKGRNWIITYGGDGLTNIKKILFEIETAYESFYFK